MFSPYATWYFRPFELQKIKSDKIIIWAKMEGKYSTEVISDHVWSERGYYYQYPNEETKEMILAGIDQFLSYLYYKYNGKNCQTSFPTEVERFSELVPDLT